MSVVIETTLGDITVDLYLQQRPVTCLNFLKLCKMKYYNFNLFHTIRSGFIAQTGDPSGEGSGGQSIWALLEGPDKRFFSGEKMPKIRHTSAGLLSMVGTADMMVGSQFFFTLAPDLDSLDGVHCVIGEVTEGQDVLRKLNDVICDESHRPYRDVRITHTVILEDPFNDPPGLRAPSRSPSPSVERLKGGRIAPDEEIDETQGKSAAEVQELIEEKEAKARATILEIVGDLPDADIAPPENVLFVCKLNPITTDDDLEIIFSRFGKIVSCEVIRDKKSGDSLQYAFIEFADKKSCEDAYFKMDNVLIDDRRIHVDFSQSVSKIKWLGKGKGVKYINDNDNETRDNQEHKIKDNRYKQRNDHRENYDKNKQRTDRKTTNYDKSERREENNSRSHSRRHERDNDSLRRDIRREHRNEDRYKDNHIHKKDYRKDKNENGDSHDKNRRKADIHSSNYDNNKKVEKTNKLKHKQLEENSESSNKKRKLEKEYEIRTPSPIIEKKKEKRETKHKEKPKSNTKKSRNIKKKRKPSTSSSDSDSSDSTSSSSDSSTSSEEDCKKRKSKKKNRKYSSSSSSSDTSSSSTSSSDSSSDSSSSSSDSDHKKRKKHKKNVKIKSSRRSKKK